MVTMRRLQQRGVVVELSSPQVGTSSGAVRGAVSVMRPCSGCSRSVGGRALPLVVRHLLFGGDKSLHALDGAVDVHPLSVSAESPLRHRA